MARYAWVGLLAGIGWACSRGIGGSPPSSDAAAQQGSATTQRLRSDAAPAVEPQDASAHRREQHPVGILDATTRTQTDAQAPPPDTGGAQAAGPPSSDAGGHRPPPDAQLPPAAFESHCHGLQRQGCLEDAMCVWATGAIDAQLKPGCFESCRQQARDCGAAARCDLVLSEVDSCGELACLPEAELSLRCMTSIPCAGEAAQLCGLQRPHHCGPCDGCVDEPQLPHCLVAPDGTRHWLSAVDNVELRLPARWTTCSRPVSALQCVDEEPQ